MKFYQTVSYYKIGLRIIILVFLSILHVDTLVMASDHDDGYVTVTSKKSKRKQGTLDQKVAKSQVSVDVQIQAMQAQNKVQADAVAEQQKLQAEREANERAEQQKLQAEREANERAEQQKLQAECEANERAEQQKLQAEREANERAEQQKLQAEREANERAEQQKLQAEREANERAEQQKLQAEREANERAEQQKLQAEREANERAEQQKLQAEREANERAEQQKLQAEREANERAEQQKLQAEREANERAEQQKLQAEYQQCQTNSIRVDEEYVKKPESQQLAEAINNMIVGHTENAFVSAAQKEVIREKSTLVIKNPEKYAVELAQELVKNKAELKEVIKIANYDAFVVGKTQQEQALLFATNLAQVAPDNIKKVVEHLTEQGTRAVNVANMMYKVVTSNINNHLSGGTMVAVAAGDQESPIVTKKGLWVIGTFGSSNQDAHQGNPSYKGTVSGGIIGGDIYIGENSLVGIAYSRMNADFRFKDPSTGDKLSAESDIISLYGQQQFSIGLILQEIFSASNSKINTKNLRQVGPNRYKTASGKYTSKAYGFEGNIGYQFSVMDGINLMPNIGIRYNTYKDTSYIETGTGVNNMYIAGTSGNLTTGILGIKITTPKRVSNDAQIVPGLHASIENSLSNKQPKVKARFIWADNYFEKTTSNSTPKVSYTVGANLLASYKNIELLATYHCNLRNKYTSHQGSLKLKILF
ncbi:autotransporter domain-containing protein [Rickettsia endosymbiont of Urophora cardui]|uniref:autotransporter domain-containing protein n=2 Tax=Rickettsia endosymbiont of Urophora cardui TaxID=3066265 RepID=UPI00313C562A